MDKKVAFEHECHKLALRVYGKAYADLTDSQVATVSNLARHKQGFNVKSFLLEFLINLPGRI